LIIILPQLSSIEVLNLILLGIGGFKCPYMNINAKSAAIVLRYLLWAVTMKKQAALNAVMA
jgi:hypothetical protein